MFCFPREARDLFFVPDTTNKQTTNKNKPQTNPEGAREAIFGGFGAGRDAEGAREAIFGGFWAGRDAEGAREAIFPARSAGFVLRA